MKKEDLFDDDFLKPFKTGKELSNFLMHLQKRCLDKIPEGEPDDGFSPVIDVKVPVDF